MMRLTFLGTGTSTGIPQIGCRCEVCTSPDSRDKRLRASALLATDGGANILIDCGPDFRSQILAVESPRLDCLLLTHQHADHVGGIDDLRPYCYPSGFDIYCKVDVARDLRERLPYCFAQNPYPGVPQLHLHNVDPYKPFTPAGTDVEITPIPLMHWNLPILGYRFGPLAYITDCKTMPESSLELLRGVDTLVINALRIEPHPSHLSLSEALAIVDELHPRATYLTHFSHQLGRHADVQGRLPEGVFLAYDGLTVDIPSKIRK